MRPPRVLLNASTIIIGGGVQASVSFIRYLLKTDSTIDWSFAVSSVIESELKKFNIVLPHGSTLIFTRSPARSNDAKRKLLEFEESVDPILVFTFFVPAYIKFKSFHLCWVADGWVTHSTTFAFSTISNKIDRLVMLIRCIYKGYWYRFADSWWVEAEVARVGLAKRLFIPKNRIALVPNTFGDQYKITRPKNPYIERSESKVRCLTFSAYYPNKNLEIIPLVAESLVKMGFGDTIEFVVTLPDDEPGLKRLMTEARLRNVDHLIVNVGGVALKDGPSLYLACDILFMPSVLETYSACFPEAMIMGLPIVTTDMKFCKDVCGDAALFYAPKNPIDASEKISLLIESEELRALLISKGHIKANTLLGSDEKNQMLVNLVVKNID